MFVPVLIGSDVTTASVATGQTDYWPLYASVGNIHNNIRCGHGNGLVLVGFLAIPKSKHLIYLTYARVALIPYYSDQDPPDVSRLPSVSSSIVPCVVSKNIRIPQAWNDKA